MIEIKLFTITREVDIFELDIFSIKTSKTFKQKYRAVATRVRVTGVDFSKDYMIPEGQGDWTAGDLEFFCSAQV